MCSYRSHVLGKDYLDKLTYIVTLDGRVEIIFMIYVAALTDTYAVHCSIRVLYEHLPLLRIWA